MTDKSALLLNTTSAQVQALTLTLHVLIVHLVKSGALPAESFAQQLQHEAEKLPSIDSHENELLAAAHQERDRLVLQACQYARLADAARR